MGYTKKKKEVGLDKLSEEQFLVKVKLGELTRDAYEDRFFTIRDGKEVHI